MRDPFRSREVRRLCAALHLADTEEAQRALVAQWLAAGTLTREELLEGVEAEPDDSVKPSKRKSVERLRHTALGAPREPSRVYRLPHEPQPSGFFGQMGMVARYETRLKDGDSEIVEREGEYQAAVTRYEQALAEWRRAFLAGE